MTHPGCQAGCKMACQKHPRSNRYLQNLEWVAYTCLVLRRRSKNWKMGILVQRAAQTVILKLSVFVTETLYPLLFTWMILVLRIILLLMLIWIILLAAGPTPDSSLTSGGKTLCDVFAVRKTLSDISYVWKVFLLICTSCA